MLEEDFDVGHCVQVVDQSSVQLCSIHGQQVLVQLSLGKMVCESDDLPCRVRRTAALHAHTLHVSLRGSYGRAWARYLRALHLQGLKGQFFGESGCRAQIEPN